MMHTPHRWLWPPLALLLALALASPAAAQDAQEIMRSALERNSTGFQTGAVEMTVTTEDKGGTQKVRRLSAMSKRSDQGLRTRVRLLAPDEVKGQSFLFRQVKGGEDQVYWYLPSFAVTRRIQGEGKKGSFMGTHLTYADLESRDLKDATYKKLADEKIGPHEVFVIEATPADQSEHQKVLAYVRKEDRILLKVRFYDTQGKESRVLFVEKLDKQNGETYAKQLTLRPTAGGYTRMVIDKLDTRTDIPDVIFSPEALSHE